MFSLIQMLGRSAPEIEIVDVGAMWLGAEHVPYRALLKGGKARVVGFEPVQRECDRLNAMNLPGQTFLPYCIGDGSERTFVRTNEPMTSSLLEPDLRLCGRFNHLAELMQPVERTHVATRRLDDLAEVRAADFLKIDVQGAELGVLRGAERLLGGTLVVQSEVNFVPQYVGSTLYGDVDAFLRERGFIFHTFASLTGRAFKPLVPKGDITAPMRQVLFGDGVWVRHFLRFDDLTAEQLLKIAVVMHEVYGSFDLAGLALAHHERKTRAGLWGPYMSRVLGGRAAPPLPELD